MKARTLELVYGHRCVRKDNLMVKSRTKVKLGKVRIKGEQSSALYHHIQCFKFNQIVTRLDVEYIVQLGY